MSKINRILACIDFSDYSLMTLACAVELAKEQNAQIVVLNVINQRDLTGVEMASSHFPETFSMKDYIRNMKKERHDIIKKMIMEHYFDDKSMMSILIDKGVPFECILKTVDSENIDLVVMANKGRGNVSRVLFGSAAEKVFRHSPVPVISVRERSRFKRSLSDD